MTNTPNTNNPIDHEPLLTAYALGELEPTSTDYQRIAALIASDANARAFVQQARTLGEQLNQRYAAEQSDASLTSGQQQTLNDAIERTTPMTTPTGHNNAPRPLRLPRPVLIAAGLALAAGAAIAVVSLTGGDNGPTQTQTASIAPVGGFAEVNNAMQTPIAVDFENAKLSEVLAFVNKQTGVSIKADWASLEKRGVGQDTPVSLTAEKPQPAQRLLSAALQQAWQQSPHPDPAQWTMSDEGVLISPKSSLVQARLNATAKLLETRRFSKAPYDAGLVKAGIAEIWDTDLWNQVQDKRAEAGKRIIEEARVCLDAADQALSDKAYEKAAEHNVYAYHLLARYAVLLPQDQAAEPFKRIGNLQQTITQSMFDRDKALIAKQIELAKTNDTELDAHTASMQAAIEAMDNHSFAAATQAVLQARTALAKQHPSLDPKAFRDRAQRVALLQAKIEGLRQQTAEEHFAQATQQIGSQNPSTSKAIQADRSTTIQKHLSAARAYQLDWRYEQAEAELDAALALAPDNAAIQGLRDIIKGSATTEEHHKLHRQRELTVADQSLINIKATTPFNDILTYPGEWPEPRLLADNRRSNLGRGKFVTLGLPGQSINGRLSGGILQAEASSGPQQGQGNMFWRGDSAGQPNFETRYSYFNHSAAPSPTTTPLAYGLGIQPQSPPPIAPTGSQMPKRPVIDTPINSPVWLGTKAPASIITPVGSPQKMTDQILSGNTISGESHERLDHTSFAISLSKPNETQSRRALAQQQLEGLEHAQGKGNSGPRPSVNEPKKSIDEIEKDIDQANAFSDKDRAQLKETFEQRQIELKQTEPFELARIQAIQDLADLEQQFIEGCQEAMLPEPQLSRDAYALVNDNPFHDPLDEGKAMSTFSVDVDTAAYTLARRQLMQQNRMPVPKAVRVEEMINYFDYGYDAPVVDGRALEDGVVTQQSLEAYEKTHDGFAPFATHTQLTDAPWQPSNKLVRVGIQGMEVAQEDRPPCHLTFLLDVSGSMNSENKLGLVKKSLMLLLDKLNEQDRVSIVTYAGRTKTIITNTPATDRDKIEKAFMALRAGGSTAGAAGIQLAYDAATKHYIDGGVNRVILCTDGDFNVGIRDTDDLVALIKDKANPNPGADGKRRGVYLSVLGYGMGNLNDAMMEPLTNAGNGHYAYIDTLNEATKVMYDQAGSTLVTIAKDVKVQVHFDANQVLAYRLIGYENRVLANEDFANDQVDAGDIGAGHSVTAMYELITFDDGLGDDDTVREVKLQIDKLDQAIALNNALMQTAALTANQLMRLQGATQLLTQERSLAGAAIQRMDSARVSRRPPTIDKPAVLPIEPPTNDPQPPAIDPDYGKQDGEPNVIPPPADPTIKVELDKFKDGAMLAVKLRYKPVDAPAEDGTSRLIETRVFAKDAVPFAQANESTRFATAVAGFGMLLRSSPHAGEATYDWVLGTAKDAMTHDPGNLRREFLEIVGKAKDVEARK